MIRSSRHRGLKRLARHDILARLDAARVVGDMDMPGFRLHALKGASKGIWAVTVRANWRVTFRFVDPDAFEVDYVDYH
jgi:proteic killer suppression protein